MYFEKSSTYLALVTDRTRNVHKSTYTSLKGLIDLELRAANGSLCTFPKGHTAHLYEGIVIEQLIS